MADSTIRFRVDLDNKDAIKNSKKFNTSLGNMAKNAKEAGLALAGVAGIAVALKKAFDFGKKGAEIDQVTESFNRMNDSVFKTPDLLNKMRAAVGGTIRDFNLMSGLMVLVAGTTEEMSRKFAEASPQLLKIAKAAQKLNPTLGDTAFLYQSLATGIKRSSPLILDNLGLVVRIGKANKDYAKSLGKTQEELTASEQQLSLLNATLEAGNRLIEQVGGSVDSATDAYSRFGVELADTLDQGATFLDSVLRPLIDGFLFLDKTISEGTADNFILRGLGNLLLWDRALRDIHTSINDVLIFLGLVSEEAKKVEEIFEFPEVVVVGEKIKNSYVRLTEEIKILKESLKTISDNEFPNVIRLIKTKTDALRELTTITDTQSKSVGILTIIYGKYADVLSKIQIPREVKGLFQGAPRGLEGVDVPKKPTIAMPTQQELQESFATFDSIAQGAANGMRSAFNQAWDDIFGHADNLFSAFIKSIIQQLIDLQARQLATELFNLLVSAATGVPSTGPAPALLPGIAGSMREQPINVNIGNERVAQLVVNGNNQGQRLRYF